jgi:hypothetical protein
MSHVWIVEVRLNGQWYCEDVFQARVDGLQAIRSLRNRKLCLKFRLVKYVRAS